MTVPASGARSAWHPSWRRLLRSPARCRLYWQVVSHLRTTRGQLLGGWSELQREVRRSLNTDKPAEWNSGYHTWPRHQLRHRPLGQRHLPFRRLPPGQQRRRHLRHSVPEWICRCPLGCIFPSALHIRRLAGTRSVFVSPSAGLEQAGSPEPAGTLRSRGGVPRVQLSTKRQQTATCAASYWQIRCAQKVSNTDHRRRPVR